MHGEPDDALPRGGWFVRWVDRPESPLRLKWFVIVGAVVGVCVAVGAWFYLPALIGWDVEPSGGAVLAIMAGWGTFCVVSLVGIVAQALARLSVYGPEWSVNRAAIRHDWRLRPVWVAAMDIGLIVATTAVGLWGAMECLRTGSRLGLATFLLMVGLTFQPFVRYRLLNGRWPY